MAGSLACWWFHLIDTDSTATRDKLYPSDTGTCKNRPTDRPFSPFPFLHGMPACPCTVLHCTSTTADDKEAVATTDARPGSVARYTIVMDIIIAPQLPQQQEANAQITPQEVALFQSHSSIHPSTQQSPIPKRRPRGIIIF